MTARITLSCDAAFDDGRLPCRGALPVDVDRLGGVLGEPGDLVDVDDVRDRAEAAGWSSTRTARVTRDYCPAHTGMRAARTLELDPRWAGHPAATRSAVLELLEADRAAGVDLDRARLVDLGIVDAGAWAVGR